MCSVKISLSCLDEKVCLLFCNLLRGGAMQAKAISVCFIASLLNCLKDMVFKIAEASKKNRMLVSSYSKSRDCDLC